MARFERKSYIGNHMQVKSAKIKEIETTRKKCVPVNSTCKIHCHQIKDPSSNLIYTKNQLVF
jgi:hypothetical protein